MSVRASLTLSMSASFSVAHLQRRSVISEDTPFVSTCQIQSLQCRSSDHDHEYMQRMLEDCDLQSTMRDGVPLDMQVREHD